MIYNIPYLSSAALVIIGMYAILAKRNLIKIIIGISIVESAVNLFLITIGYRKGAVAPIYTNLPSGTSIPQGLTLPVPQALTLTSIVIGVAIMALMLAMAVQIYRRYGTLDVTKIRRLRE